METRRYRIFFWQKFVPLPGLLVLGGLLAVSPIAESWSRGTWYGIAGAVGLLVAVYLANAWAKSGVLVEQQRVTLHVPGGLQTIDHDDIIKVARHGRWRVRLCVDAGLPDRHRHISMDIWDAAGFVAALEQRTRATSALSRAA